MKYIFYLFIFTAPVFSVTLNELTSYAIENSITTKQASAKNSLASIKLKENRASRYGELNFIADATHYNVDRTLAPLIPSTISSGTPITTSKDIFSGGVSYSVALFTGFAKSRDIEIDEISSKMSQIQSHLTKEQLIYNIRSLYLSILTLQEIKEAQSRYIKALKELNTIIAKEVELGKKAKIDFIKSKADIEFAQTKEAILKADIKTALATISLLSGKEVTQVEPIEIEIKEPIFNIDNLYIQGITLSKIKQRDLELLKATKSIQKSNSSNLPQLKLNSYFGKNYAKDERNDWDDETLWQVGVNLKYNILDFGKQDASTQKAKIIKLQASLKKEQSLLEIKKLLIEAIAEIQKSYAQFLGSNSGYNLSLKSEKIEKARYESNVATLNDLLLAKSKTKLAQSKLIESRYSYQKSIYYLDYLLEKGVK